MQITLSSSDYLPYPSVLPWKNIYDDLLRKRCVANKTALLIGRERTTVQYWYQIGKEPKFSEACAILLLHARYCGEEQTKFRLSQARHLVMSAANG